MRLGEIIRMKGPLQLHMDNKAAHDIAESKGLTRRVKHLEIRDAYVRILRECGVIRIIQVKSEENCADILTKVFGSPGAFAIACGNVFAIGSMSSESVGECYGDHTREYSGHSLMSK